MHESVACLGKPILEREGVRFDAHGRISLDSFQCDQGNRVRDQAESFRADVEARI